MSFGGLNIACSSSGNRPSLGLVGDIAGSPQTPSRSARCQHLREMMVVMRCNGDDEHGAVAIC